MNLPLDSATEEKPMDIVLIEDEPDCSETYEVLLSDRGHSVTIFSEADDVVEQLENISKADLVILDLMIQLGTKLSADEAPETGIAIYYRLRKLNPKLKIVVLTARSKSEVIEYFLGDKYARFNVKPVSDLDEFYETVEHWG